MSGSMADGSPLIVTAQLSDPWQNHFQALRDLYFPKKRNIVPAHITLFHALPGPVLEEVIGIAQKSVQDAGPIFIKITGIFSLGAGVAYRAESDDLAAVRARIANEFLASLTRQDAQGWKPHITVQNKASPDQAKETLALLQTNFMPIDTFIRDLKIWRYLGGPWSLVETIPAGLQGF